MSAIHPARNHLKNRQMPRTHAEHHEGTLERLGLRITLVVGTMACAFVFAVLALISLPAALESGDLIIIVGWVAQTFLQLVLLPVIIVGQNVQAKAADERSQLTYDDTEAILQSLVHIDRKLDALAK